MVSNDGMAGRARGGMSPEEIAKVSEEARRARANKNAVQVVKIGGDPPAPAAPIDAAVAEIEQFLGNVRVYLGMTDENHNAWWRVLEMVERIDISSRALHSLLEEKISELERSGRPRDPHQDLRTDVETNP